MTYTTEQLEEITSLNPAHQQAIDALLGFYQFVRSTWTANAIAQLKQAHDLDLRRKQDRLQLAHFAAREELEFARSLPQGLQPIADLPQHNPCQAVEEATPKAQPETESVEQRYVRLLPKQEGRPSYSASERCVIVSHHTAPLLTTLTTSALPYLFSLLDYQLLSSEDL